MKLLKTTLFSLIFTCSFISTRNIKYLEPNRTQPGANQVQDIIANNAFVVLDFYADWCKPCKRMNPILHSLANDAVFNEVLFVKINIDDFPSIKRSIQNYWSPNLFILQKWHRSKTHCWL